MILREWTVVGGHGDDADKHHIFVQIITRRRFRGIQEECGERNGRRGKSKLDK